MFFEFADLNFSGEANELGAEIESGALAVKTFQYLDQQRGNQEGGVGVVVRISNEKTGPIGVR